MTEQTMPDDAAEAVRKYLDALANHLCPVCNAPVETKEQHGRCVYAQPCGHRMYQGTVEKRAKHEQ